MGALVFPPATHIADGSSLREILYKSEGNEELDRRPNVARILTASSYLRWRCLWVSIYFEAMRVSVEPCMLDV